MSTKEEIKEAVKALLVSPETAKKVVDVVVHGKKPDGWSRRSNCSYYNAHYAEQLRVELDAMMEDRQNRMYWYSSYPDLSEQTIYLRINQSLRYLVDRLDPDGRYANFLSTVAITRERKKGVLLSVTSGSEFKAALIVPKQDAPKWKDRMEEWLEESEPGDKPFVVENLMLTPEEIKELKLQFVGLKNIMASVTSSTIKLIKVAL